MLSVTAFRFSLLSYTLAEVMRAWTANKNFSTSTYNASSVIPISLPHLATSIASYETVLELAVTEYRTLVLKIRRGFLIFVICWKWGDKEALGYLTPRFQCSTSFNDIFH